MRFGNFPWIHVFHIPRELLHQRDDSPLAGPPSSYPIPLEIKASFLFSPILVKVPYFPSFCSDLTIVALAGPPTPDMPLPLDLAAGRERRGNASRSLGDVSIPHSLRDGWGHSTALEFVGGKRSLSSESFQSQKTHT